jgi:hypothetical protein
MNTERRILIRVIIAQLEQISERLDKVRKEEEEQYESRSSASKETSEGVLSLEAIDFLDTAANNVAEDCELLRKIVGSG